MSLHEIGALIHTDPDLARRKIIDALRETGGNRERAARVLNAGARSLYRWIERLDMWSAVDAVREPLPAPPRARDRIVSTLRRTAGDTARAAHRLRLSESTLRRRMDELGVARAESPASAPPPPG